MLGVSSGSKLFFNKRNQITRGSTFLRSYEPWHSGWSGGMTVKGWLVQPTRATPESVVTSLAAQQFTLTNSL